MTSKTSNSELDAALAALWESGELGQSLEHAVVAENAACTAADEALGLQLVSIRLQKKLVSNLKLIAKYRGVAYQPLVRDLLNRFAASELKDIFRELDASQRRAEDEEQSVVSGFMERERALKRA